MEHGLFTVDHDTRRIRGILVPWNELSKVSSTKNAPLKFEPGAIRIPRDVTVVGLNKQHDRYDPIGRAAKLEVVEQGLYSEFDIADTDEGDAWLADHGDLVRLSPELRDITRDADGTNATATLTGAGLVSQGAFASAGLFAVDEDDTPETPDPESETDEPTGTPEEKPEEPAEEEENEVAEMAATVPGALPTPASAPAKKPELTRRGLFAMIDKVAAGQATREEVQTVRANIEAASGLFALDDITYNAAGDIAPLLPPQWLGEVEDGTSYEQTFAPLFGSKTLTSLYMKGWKWTTKPVGGTWAGNKTAIPSNPAAFEEVTESAIRWAMGNDIAREHRDFRTPGFFEAYDRAAREDFDRWLDETVVLADAIAAATDIEADDPTGLTIGAGWSALIDGATEIVAAGLQPTGAVVETSLWKAMLKVPNSDVLGYLAGAIGLSRGDLAGFTFKPSNLITTGHILVVSRGAADVYTLPGSPIRAEALNIANGGIDVGMFGYGGFFVNNPDGIVDVAPYVAGP